MTEALFVANYIIEYCNDHNLEINNLRIQKLL
ncbi:TPA: Panacea domain-containing protein, partial [Streptococcus equi subsp. equi]